MDICFCWQTREILKTVALQMQNYSSLVANEGERGADL